MGLPAPFRHTLAVLASHALFSLRSHSRMLLSLWTTAATCIPLSCFAHATATAYDGWHRPLDVAIPMLLLGMARATLAPPDSYEPADSPVMSLVVSFASEEEPAVASLRREWVHSSARHRIPPQA